MQITTGQFGTKKFTKPLRAKLQGRFKLSEFKAAPDSLAKQSVD